MSSNRVTSQGFASTPTTYHVEACEIQANNVKNGRGGSDPYWYDILDMIANFSIRESINSPYLDVLIGMGDGIGLMETLKLSGNEQVYLKVKRKEFGRKTVSFTLFLRVVEIYNYTRLKPGLNTFQLKCAGEHIYKDSLTLLNESFSGTPNEIITKIVKSKLQTGLKSSEGSKNIISGVFPNVRPMSAVKWILRNTFDDGTPFFFYQTLADNGQMNCKSYKHLLNEDVFMEYEYIPFVDNDVALETENGYEYEKKTIRSIESPYNQSKLLAARAGAYASTTHSIDYYTKTYEKTVYQYSGSEYKLNKHIPFSKSDRTKISDEIFSDHPGQKQYFLSLNSGAFENSKNYTSPAKIDFPKAMSYLNNLSYQKHRIQIAGDFEMKVGNIIQINIFKSQENTDGSGTDKLQSGKYMVTSIDHVFDKGFYQYLTIQRDSSEVDLDASK